MSAWLRCPEWQISYRGHMQVSGGPPCLFEDPRQRVFRGEVEPGNQDSVAVTLESGPIAHVAVHVTAMKEQSTIGFVRCTEACGGAPGGFREHSGWMWWAVATRPRAFVIVPPANQLHKRTESQALALHCKLQSAGAPLTRVLRCTSEFARNSP